LVLCVQRMATDVDLLGRLYVSFVDFWYITSVFFKLIVRPNVATI